MAFLALTFFLAARADVPCVGDAPTHCTDTGLNCSGSSSLPPAQCEAYQQLYDSTAGHGWNKCNATRNDPCSCHGSSVVTLCQGGDLVSIVLNANNLRGTVPDAIALLTGLKFLELGNNQHAKTKESSFALHGTVPASLGKLTNLETLHLGGSDWLTGPIPTELGNLSRLTGLYLYHNRLHGTIPASLANLAHLKVLYLYNNRLSGAVPALGFDRIGEYCGIGDAKGPNDGNRYCKPLPKGASHCNHDGAIKTSGTCAPTPAPAQA